MTQLLPARERVKVLFEILGQPTEMEIDENSLDFPSAHPMSTGMIENSFTRFDFRNWLC